MNWRASLLGAVIVAVAGLGVGVAVGGRTKVETRTVTVAHGAVTTVTVTASTPVADTTSSSATTEPASSGGQGATQQYLADYLDSQGPDELNNEASGVSLVADPSSLQLKGRTYQHAVSFEVDNYNSGSNSFQMPIAGYGHLKAAIVGLDTLSSASTSYRLTIYKDHGDTPNATVLYRQTFHGPSETHSLDFDTQGATVLVLDWTQIGDEPDSSNDFIMADPVITG